MPIMHSIIFYFFFFFPENLIQVLAVQRIVTLNFLKTMKIFLNNILEKVAKKKRMLLCIVFTITVEVHRIN